MASLLNPMLRTRIEQATRADSTMCWNCSSCDAECPVEIATDRLRPQRIVRLANWLCVQCGRCTEACPQGVDGCRMIASLREIAVQEGKVHADFALQAQDAQKLSYRRWVDDVDRLFGFAEGRVKDFACLVPVAACV